MKAQAANKYFTKLWRNERSYVRLLTVLLAVLLSLMCSSGLAGAQAARAL